MIPKYSSLRSDVYSYYLEYLEDSAQIGTILDNLTDLDLNSQALYDAAVKALDPNNCSWTRRHPWFPIKLNRNEHTIEVPLKYGELPEEDYDPTIGIAYGENAQRVVWDMPADMLDPGMLLTSPYQPAEVFVKGSNMAVSTLKNGVRRIELPITIFDLPSATSEEGNSFITLWAKFSTWTNEYYYAYNERALGINVDRDPWGALLIKGAYSSAGRGVSTKDLFECISGAAKAPVAVNEEVVEFVGEDKVLTDKGEYRVSNLTTTVSVGDKLTPGSQLVTELRVFRGAEIASAGDLTVTRLPGSKDVFDVNFTSTPSLPTLYGTDSNGYAKVRLESTGTALDKFWDTVHANAITSGKTLAELLTGTKTPTAAELNTPIDSLKFLAESVLVNDYLIEIDTSVLKLEDLERYRFLLSRLSTVGSQIWIKAV